VIRTHHLLLDYALICTHFWRFLDEFDYGVCVYNIFERVNLRYRCVYCYQSSEVKWGEVKWGEERWGDERRVGWYFWSPCGGVCVHFWSDDSLVILWRSVNTSSFTIWRWRRSWWTFVLSSEALVWLTTKLLCVECVAVSTIAPVCRTKELCRIYLSQCSVIDRSSSLVWSFVLCELEFSSSSCCTLCVVRRA